MTLIAAFRCRESILLCADREESSGLSKKASDKLQVLMAQPWVTVVANAGSAPLADLAAKRLGESLGHASCRGIDYLEANHEQIIIDVLTRVHEDHIWKNPRTDHKINLIIGLSFAASKTQYLYVTEDNIPQPITTYCCRGYGEDLCTYFAEHLYEKRLTPDEMILLAALIFREVNASVQFCGKGTDMVLLRPGELAMSILPDGVESIQRTIPPFSEVVNTFWKSTKLLPKWVTAIGEAARKAERSLFRE
ncbi:MAG TPA: hypothetical protein VI386_24335 [Candidatus Sulfotelmatobacter sp.]